MNAFVDNSIFLKEDTLVDQIAYWSRQLEHAPALLALPTDHPRPAIRNFGEATHPFVLPQDVTNGLKVLTHREEVSLHTLLVGTFLLLLHRYTGQEDLLLGMPVSGGGDLPQAEKLIDSPANTVVLRVNVSGNPTFLQLLNEVSSVIRGAQENADVPFEYLVEQLHIQQNEVQHPLFQVMLTLYPSSFVLPSEWTSAESNTEADTFKLDLSLELCEQREGLFGRFRYSTELFDAMTIDRMFGHWQTLLESIVVNPTQHIGAVPLLTEEERHQLLVEWNSVDSGSPIDACIHQLFEERVKSNPDAIAVTFEQQSLTYSELNRKANQLAHYLQHHGVGPEVKVGMYVERSLEMIVGLLAILKAGGAYVPLDLTYPSERIAFMLADTGAPVLCTQQSFVEKLPEYNGHILCLDTDQEKIDQESEENLVSGATGNNLAYVIYTSGSTGKPKGVLINHISAVRLFEATRALFHFDHRDVWSLFHSYAFDFSVWELWNPLVSGGRVVVVPYEVSRSSEAFYKLLCTERVTILNQCPSAFHQLIRAEESSDDALSLALRVVIFGCEAFEVQTLKPWLDRQGSKAPHLVVQAPQLVVMYGPTETTVFDTYYPLSVEDLERASKSIIGRPIPGSQIFILDQYRQPVPVGVPGEIFIGGAGIARGYLNRPELTAERFVHNPFSEDSAARLYKTGDLARFLPNGNVEFLGRVDDQVKIRGFRVELGEIDAVISQHPAVAEEVVIVREDKPGDKRLVAYLVAAQGQTLTIRNMRSYIAERLPAYMVPSAFVLMDALPLTHNSKIDKRALPPPAQTERATEEMYVPPTSMVHYQLIEIWEELLDTHPIGIRDNFFTIGGHSLLATRMLSQFEQMSGIKVPLATLFANPTIEQLYTALQQEEDKTNCYPLVAVQSKGTQKPFFFLHGDWTGGAFYCFSLANAAGIEQPYYALEPYRVDGIHIPATLEDMAAGHLASLRSFQPEGPYLLGGYCNGALLAFEMAQQLRAEGQVVDLLLLMGPAQPGYLGTLRTVIHRVGKLLKRDQDTQANWFLAIRHALRHVYRYTHSSNDTRLQDFSKLLEIDARLNHMFPPSEALRKDYVGIFTWLAAGYSPEQYPGKITFFWADEEPSIKEGWEKSAKATEVENYTVPGTLIASVTEHIGVVAKYVSMCLSKAQRFVLEEQDQRQQLEEAVD